MASRLRTAKICLLSKESERRIRQPFGHDQSVFFLEIVSCCSSRDNSLQVGKTCSALSKPPHWHWLLVPSKPLRQSSRPLCALLPSSPPNCDHHLAWFIFWMMMDDLIIEIRQESATRREAKCEQKGRDRALSYGPLLISFVLPYAREACVDAFGERRKNEVRKGNAYCMSLTCQQLCLGFSCFHICSWQQSWVA